MPERTDHNEAMSARYTLDFTNTLDGGKAAVITDTVTQCGLYLYSDSDSLAFGMVEQQAERIAELEGERDQLRAEVERLRREKANAIDKAGHMLAAGMGLSNCAFNLKQRVGEPLSIRDVAALESSQRAWDAALDASRTTHKDTE